MKLKKNSKYKSPAQAMVEFAIALPVLLMLMYGILEAGRLMFLYSTVVTASRQAVRYGSATGSGGDFTAQGGPNNSIYIRYQDCYGIRAAANRAGFLGPFDSITILHDQGVTTSNPPTPINQQTYCGGASEPTYTVNTNNTRLVVTVSEQFTPIVPKLVPFLNRTITATSARTILYSVDIQVTAPPGSFGGGGGSGGLTLVISTNPVTFGPPNAGQTISVFYLVTNTGGTDLATPITFSNFNGSTPDCTGQPGVLTAGGGSFTCTGTYTITQTDMDSGHLTVRATANVSGATDDATVTITGTMTPSLTLDKSGPIAVLAENNTSVDYTYTLTNSGNVTLGAPYSVTDDKVANNNITCPGSGNILPGGSITCTGTYALKNSDISAGSLTNIATASAVSTSGAQTITSNSDSWTVMTPAILLTVTSSSPSASSVGQVITFTYRITNNIPSTIGAPYAVNDSRVTNETCPSPAGTLNPGQWVDCTGTYTVTQADLDAGVPLTSAISATATKATNPGSGSSLPSNSVTFNLTVVQTPSLNLTVVAAPNPATVLNTVVTYTYTLTNNGNVTLSPPFNITDDKVSGITCTNPAVAMAPGGAKTCSGSRTITQSDLDDGSVTNTATATASLASGTINSNTVTNTVTTFTGPRLTVQIVSNPGTYTSAGQILSFGYILKNTGNVALAPPYAVTSNIAGSGDCSAALASIPVGGSISCIGQYTTSAADVTNTILTNQASATASGGAVTSGVATLDVYLQGVPTRTPLPPTSTPCPTIGSTTLTKSSITAGGLVRLTWTSATNAASYEVHRSTTNNFTPDGTTLVRLTWAAATNATSYEVHRSTTNNFTPDGTTLLTTISSPTLTYDAPLGAASGTYYFKVVPKNTCSSGSASNQVSATKYKVSGTLTKDASVTSTLNMSNVTIAGTGATGVVSCSNTAGTSYQCDVIDSSGTTTITFGAYYGSPGNAPNNNNKTCGSTAAPTGSVSNNASASERTAYGFALAGDVTFNITIARHDDTPPPANCTATQ